MAIPPRGDPRRPVHWAAASCRVLGALAVLATTCAGLPLVRLLGRRRGAPFPSLITLLIFGCYGGVGAAHFVFAHFIGRGRTWAVIVALCLTGVLTLAIPGGVAFAIAEAVVAAPRNGPPWFMFAALAIPLLVLVALGQLIYHLTQSVGAMRLGLPDEARGFDVSPVTVEGERGAS